MYRGQRFRSTGFPTLRNDTRCSSTSNGPGSICRIAVSDALIATSPVNITYFTDYFIWIDALMKEYMVKPGASPDIAQGYALFPFDGEPALMVTSSMLAVNGVDLWVRDLRISGAAGLDWSLAPKRVVRPDAPECTPS